MLVTLSTGTVVDTSGPADLLVLTAAEYAELMVTIRSFNRREK